MAECSEQMEMYFSSISDKLAEAYKIANEARSKGYDPDDTVSVALTKDLSERVEGLVSVVAPQIKGSGICLRIKELESVYGSQDWRVALHIALEVAQEKFCKFKTHIEAMEMGVRTGFFFFTVGVVASPLEGFLRLEIKKRADGKEYLSPFYMGPVRSAGGTAGAVSLVIVDYIRKNMGYDIYDPTLDEIKRAYSEISHYHERITNLQYFPSEQEVEFMTRSLPIQVDGDPTEKLEVPNYKYLPRIKSNILRGGYCLVIAELICAKAKKVWARMSKWAESEGLDHWKFLNDFVSLQASLRAKTKGDVKKEIGILPDNSYLKDLVAGRPILGHPMRKGAFRVRYGRTRVSGFSTNGVHPMTMYVLDGFIAIGTQLKGERPGKGCGVVLCDSVEPPIIKLKDGSVMFLENLEQYKQVKKEIEEILFVGDMLMNYGDFLDRGHKLFTPGYCEEWWALELEKSITNDNTNYMDILRDPIKINVSCDDAINISKTQGIPLHPKYTYHWADVSIGDVLSVLDWINNSQIAEDKIILPLVYNYRSDLSINNPKRVLELIGVPHKVINKEFVVIESDWCKGIKASLGFYSNPFSWFKVDELLVESDKTEGALGFVNKLSEIVLRDKSGVYVGFRMGRPEKGKLRKMTGSPQVMFPIGDEGGRLRCFQSALEKGKISAQFPLYYCSSCNSKTIYQRCHKCGARSEKRYYCKSCGEIVEPCGHNPVSYTEFNLPIKEYFDSALKLLEMRNYSDLIKGVRGTSNKDHIPEHLTKGILRAVHSIYVNKDGTTRFDMTELPITHFKPKEVCAPVEKLVNLGYNKDVFGADLVDTDQILELKCQDVILPTCVGATEDGADIVLARTARFIDDLLVKLYKCQPYYNIKRRDDLLGHIIVGLSPHTSAGIVGRIIGFSSTQALIAHPLFHSIMRRDCDGDEAGIMLLLDTLINFSPKLLSDHRGAKQDEPLVLTSKLIPSEVDDMVFNMDVCWKYPLEFYEACMQYKYPSDVPMDILKKRLFTPAQYEGYGFTHNTDNFNDSVTCSSYKSLPTMQDKVQGQMLLADKLRCVDEDDVARLVIERHFLRDLKGNLRKFSQQEFRCVKCNEKFRRPPLKGVCTVCGGKILFTISEGSIVKYLQPCLTLLETYELPHYLRQSIELLQQRIDTLFGKDPEVQEGLDKWV